MGNDKQTTEQSQQTQQTVRPTPTEQEQRILNQQEAEFMAGAGGREELNKLLPQTLTGILSGGEGLPQAFTNLFAGIGPEMIREMSGEAVADIVPQFAAQGILDSGTAASIAGRTAGDIRRGVAESNLNRVQNLLGMGLMQGAGTTQAGTGNLNAALAGLRTMNTTGSMSGTSTTTSMNPFLRSFQTGLGTGLSGLATGGISGGASFLGTPKGATGYNPGLMSGYSGQVPMSGLGYTPVYGL